MAVWRPGAERIAVTSPEGGWWEYDVTPDGEKPLSAFLRGTPWCAYPGSRWEEQPPGPGSEGRGLEWNWVIAVYPESAEAARELGISWPLELREPYCQVTSTLRAGNGKVTGLKTPRRAVRLPGGVPGQGSRPGGAVPAVVCPLCAAGHLAVRSLPCGP